MRKAYAKINIGLYVKGKRPDGFHDLDSYFHLIGISDDIDLDFFPSSETVVNIRGNGIYLDEGKEDLMAKALRLFSEKSYMCFRAEISIEKHIPFKAGLGGGSSDAGLVLRWANEYYDHPLTQDELMEVAAEVGSDVPFFVSGFACAHVRGRGEVIEKAEPLCGSVDVFMPSWNVETKGAFRLLDGMERKERSLPDPMGPLSPEIYENDFELVSPRSESIMNISKCYSWFSMSGSGSSYIGIGKLTGSEEKIAECTVKGEEITVIPSFMVSFS